MEETEAQGGEGTVPSFYCAGLPDFHPCGGGHIRSLVLAGWPGGNCATSPELSFPISRMGCCVLAGHQSVWGGTELGKRHPVCVAQGEGPAAPYTPQQKAEPPGLPVPPSRKGGSLIARPVSLPGGCARYWAADRKCQSLTQQEATCPMCRRGNRGWCLWLLIPETKPSHVPSDSLNLHVQSWQGGVGFSS